MPPARTARSAAARIARSAPARSAPARKPARTTARTTAPPRPRVRTRKPPRRRIRWDRLGRVALLLVLAVVIGLYAQHALAYLSLRSQAAQQQATVKRLERDNAALAREQRSLNDPATIQRDARALGMVKPGERPYVITGLPAGR